MIEDVIQTSWRLKKGRFFFACVRVLCLCVPFLLFFLAGNSCGRRQYLPANRLNMVLCVVIDTGPAMSETFLGRDSGIRAVRGGSVALTKLDAAKCLVEIVMSQMRKVNPSAVEHGSYLLYTTGTMYLCLYPPTWGILYLCPRSSGTSLYAITSLRHICWFRECVEAIRDRPDLWYYRACSLQGSRCIEYQQSRSWNRSIRPGNEAEVSVSLCLLSSSLDVACIKWREIRQCRGPRCDLSYFLWRWKLNWERSAFSGPLYSAVYYNNRLSHGVCAFKNRQTLKAKRRASITLSSKPTAGTIITSPFPSRIRCHLMNLHSGFFK